MRLFPLLLLLTLLLTPVTAVAAKIRIAVQTPGGIEQKVYLTRPVNLAPDRPIVFVMHDSGRNADECRDQWHKLALEHDFLLVVPEFSERQFPGIESYNLGNVFDADGKVQPRALWSFATIEPIFDEVRRRFDMQTGAFTIYGHSAGAQFVHGFLYHVPRARVTRAVAASAGWYTMPVFDVDFPYGLRRSVVQAADLAAAVQLPLTVLLGESDTDPHDPDLRRTQEALAQGPDRLARGQAFFATGSKVASGLGVPFGWQLLTVPGADHDSRLMAPAALPWLLEEADAERPAPGAQGGQQEPERMPEVLPVTGL
jgi:poly(3-hydroxybutyrate) depolymerase